MTEAFNPLRVLPVTTPLHRCEGCLQVFGSGRYAEDTFRCRQGCEGDFHAECILLHHHEHDELREFANRTQEGA
jgi:hypothetical protein